jgi:hypothetical protein
MTNQEEATGTSEPRQTRRDVSWSVMFRLARTSVWVEWSSGHRDSSEAVRAAECLVPMDSVADIRFDRVIRQRDMFDLHGLSLLADKEAS